MKPFLLDESTFAFLIIATLIQFASSIPSAIDEEKLLRTKRSEELPLDSGVAEARSHFASIALPPTHRHRYDRQPQPSERSWRFIQGPRFVPHSEGHKPLRRYHVPPPNIRVSPYPHHPGEQIPYPHVPQRGESNRNFNDHYLREYPHGHQQQRLQEHQVVQRPPQTIFTPHPQVRDFLSFRDPPSRVKVPEDDQSLRHYNVGLQLSTEVFPNYNEREIYHENKKEDNAGFKTTNDKDNETKSFLPYYEDYAGQDYYENEEYVEVSTENSPLHTDHGVIVNVKDHDSSSIFSNSELKETPANESNENRPKNLASLLAGTAVLKTDDTKGHRSSNSTKKHPSRTRTRTTTPEQTDENYYYPDYLYDEFADIYFDSENKTGEEGNIPSKTKEDLTKGTEEGRETSSKSLSSTTNEDLTKGTDRQTSSKSLSSTTNEEGTLTTQPTWSDATNSSPLDATLAKKLTTLLKSTLSAAATERPDTTNPPISLSEIIQELGMNLPQFLGTLKTHGTSLKDFTAKLQTKSLSKSEFRRAKGNVKKLLEILESIPEKGNKFSSLEESLSTTTKIIPTVPKPTKSSTSKISQITTTEKLKISAKPSRPLIFGSGSGGIPFLNTNTKSQEISKNISNDNIEASEDITLKPPISIDLDISHILTEKGINTADILQDFGKMFNISDTKTSTLSSQNDDKTTVSLRPYQNGAERNRPYRPIDFDRGNPNIHRGIINSRLSSTSRPTLRPPYSPKPPSINYGDTEDEVQTSVEFIYNPETKVNNKDNDSDNKRNNKKYDEYNYNIAKTSPENLDVSTRSAIMAAGILGGVALSVFIAIFIVVKYRNHMHRNRRRIPLTLPSDSSSSSLPPIYASRNVFGKEAYETSGFWTTLKKRFDPYSTSSSPTSM